ncbi:peptidoglycan D,D-transpeptidase FtsI family protein [Desulfuribacillus alkaliarsenatis]|uniref:Penicillin-binding protein 2 n=1 Tax=Desulfuribacillus alkaliarsenatis TaxID=766136 RepID=A0A1E5G0G2_9FIRM|nr:penicillin-binding protein 2 [Desulfuribacillus alkaliarsenatis]OEF96304.1 hypothetical protein BHF68_09085 [Desulfuribacillus alkaliarsenatis]
MVNESSRLFHIRRIILLLFIISASLVAIIIHLGYIQIVSSGRYQGVDLVANSIEQRSRSVLLDIGRGDVLARDYTPITGREKLALLLLPRRLDITTEDYKIRELAIVLEIDEALLLNKITNISYPQLLTINNQIIDINTNLINEIKDINLSGAMFVDAKERYPEDMIAKHIVGFIGEDSALINANFAEYLAAGVYSVTDVVGKKGLEYNYELEIKSEGAKYLSYYIYQDRNLNLHPFYGLGMNIQGNQNQHRPLNIITTLDYNLQEYSERLLDKYNVEKGAIVVLEVNTGDIVAMASRPDYNPNQIIMDEYENTRNRATTASFPGSVFKTVIALGVLEEGIATIHDQFYCSGSLEFTNGQSLQCWKEHGDLTLLRAFAESCNTTFAQLAIKLGRENILKYANALGLGDVVSYYDLNMNRLQLYNEEEGSIFQVKGENQQLLANTGIGQQDVRMTPIQAANMMAIIANYGKHNQPRIVSELQSKSGHTIHKYNNKSVTNNIGRHSYYQLQRLLAAVVEDGTASQLHTKGIAAAGKTGTAEIGKTGRVNRWFTGYFPDKYPQYSIAIIIEDVASWEQTGTSINIFSDIVKYISD